MRYFYMDNYRGFTNQVVPLASTNFLVGENSSGKSSFVKMLELFRTPQLMYGPAYSTRSMGAFSDWVSAASADLGYVDIGIYNDAIPGADEGRDEPFAYTFRFKEANGGVMLSDAIAYRVGYLVHARFGAPKAKHRATLVHGRREAFDPRHVFDLTRKALSEGDTASFTESSNEHSEMPLSFYFREAVPKKARERFPHWEDDAFPAPLKTFAPIRSAPKAFYGGAISGYTPDGEHTPYLLRDIMAGPRRAIFAEKLRAFGEASGLFEFIEAHTFGNEKHAPFELLVKLSAAKLAISNVGYGVSQVLPLIVDFLTSQGDLWFAIQQPEVHLHPRAQAALGGLMQELALEQKFHFVVETHSDYLIDRYRLGMHRSGRDNPSAQVLFFERDDAGNHAHPIEIDQQGRFSDSQPDSFRAFFIREAMDLLDV
jgi:hypothetical protein